MLHFVLGRAGAGKTEYVRSLLCRCAKEFEAEKGKKYRRLFFIVPEQNSFESERSMLERLGEHEAGHVEVLSFTRLVDSVMREYGGLAGRKLDDCGRTLFMGLALSQTAEQLDMFRKNVDNDEFSALLLQTVAELKMGGITPDKLETAGDSLPEGTLKKKAKELSIVFSAYQALVTQSYVDPQDDFMRLEQILETHPFFEDCLVVLDAFKGFTAQEFHILEKVLRQAKDSYITLCTDQLRPQEDPVGLFAPVQRTAGIFLRMARRQGIEIAHPVHLEPGRRFKNPELSTLEALIFREGAAAAPFPCRHVEIISAGNRYDEADYAARMIRRLVRKENYRYREIAVIMRRESDYSGVIDSALEKYDIPYFMDLPQNVESKPLMAFILAAMEAVDSHWNSDAVFRCLKTGMTGLSTEEIAELENYCFIWGISGSKWETPWTGNPDGFQEGFSEEQEERLKAVNSAREFIISALSPLRPSGGKKGGEAYAAAVYQVLIQVGAPGHLRETAENFRRQGLPNLAEEQLRLWDILMKILDQTALVLKEYPLEWKQYRKLLEKAIRTAEISFIPQNLDEVLVGGADRIRPASPRAVLILGANQGMFPAPVASSGVFSDQERKLLKQAGLEMSDSMEEQAEEERFLAYTSMTSPSERLYIFYSVSSGSGEGMYPSAIVAETRKALGGVEEKQAGPAVDASGLEGERQAFETLSARWTEEDDFTSGLYGWFSEQTAYRASMEAIGRIYEGSPGEFSSPDPAIRLFGKDLYLSPSRVEKYHQCPFAYFCQYGMKARPRRPAKIDALEYGTLIHYLLENLLNAYSREEFISLTRAQLRKKVKELLQSYLETKLGGWEDKPERFRYLYRRFETTAVALATHLAAELGQSKFEPEDFELEIGKDVRALELQLPSGGIISVHGKIDRVDVMKSRGRSYVRVVDYKTGAKQFRLSDILYGLNVQMLLYLVTLWKNGSSRYGEVVPAGVLYMPAKNPQIEGIRGESEESAQLRKEAELKMSGLVLDDPAVIEGMEANVQGFYIPVKYKKDGKPDQYAQLASLSQMGEIGRHLERLLTQMGEQLHRGKIPPVPVEEACDYCDYSSVCGREEGWQVKEIVSMKNKEVFEQMEKADGEEDDRGK